MYYLFIDFDRRLVLHVPLSIFDKCITIYQGWKYINGHSWSFLQKCCENQHTGDRVYKLVELSSESHSHFVCQLGPRFAGHVGHVLEARARSRPVWLAETELGSGSASQSVWPWAQVLGSNDGGLMYLTMIECVYICDVNNILFKLKSAYQFIIWGRLGRNCFYMAAILDHVTNIFHQILKLDCEHV